MPPSPARRISPRRELRAENQKRGRSLESGILFQEKDDCLALFNEVQNKERENFLLPSNDDFDNIFSTKLRYFSDNKLGISIPARGECSDLLNAEGNKNDYDWLITPPETPLFPSLDDDAPVSLASRGRPRSQPITMSRSSTMDKGYRSARSSASPHRISLSPRSVNSTLQSKSRTFPATHSSPPLNLRHASPSRRPSPSPIKPTSPPRTSTPTPRRMSTGSAGPNGQSRARCPSPVKTSFGNSTSPKISAWQSNIHGFSSEAPPNLRTSLADRPASYVRGSSPASRNGFRSGRQSMSPTASRSVRSSHSHERDQSSSFSKGSVASSGDDDVDSSQLNPVTVDLSVARGFGALPHNKAMGLSKKANKVLRSSAPKRSFELAPRQMERKGPQNMFRPLLSSVPSSMFYVGKESPHHRSLTSRNSSITTSSNASSDQGTSGGALDTEEGEQNPEDVTSGFVKGQYPTAHDEIFLMDQADASNESTENNIIEESPGSPRADNDEPSTVVSQLDDRESNADFTQDMEFCSKCSRSFHSSELIREGDTWLCLECKGTKINSTKIVPVNFVLVGENTIGESVQILEDCGSLNVLDPSASIQESSQVTWLGETVKDHIISPVEMNQSVDPSCVYWSAVVDVSEGADISLPLKKPTSNKGHVVQSRSFTASNITCDDFSYSRDSLNSMRSSIGHSSASISSSVDLGPSRKTETHFHWQSNDTRYDNENYRYDTSVKNRCSVSSLSAGASGHVFPGVTPSCLGDSLERQVVDKDKETESVTCLDLHEQSLTSECTDVESTCTDIESSIKFKTAAELSNRLINVCSVDTLVTSEEPTSHENGDSLTNISSNSIIEENSAEISTQGDYFMQSSCTDRVDVAEVPQTISLNAIWEIKIENDDIVSGKSYCDVDSTTSKSRMNELMEYSVSLACNDVVTTAVKEIDTSLPSNCVLEESTIVLEDLGGRKPRSLTLEEATDAILFCSSIVYNLAYEAADIAISKDNSPVEVLRPAVTSVGKSSSDRRDIIRSRTMARRSPKSQKARQRKLETDTKPPPIVNEIKEKRVECNVKSPGKSGSMNPPKLESKCNCMIM
ncbi:hypothetical protein OROGR_003728 [Orobanche gracilis]